MRKRKNNIDKYDIGKHENKHGIGRHLSSYAADNLANADAGKLSFRIFYAFCAFVVIDYFLTIFNIHSHLNEFNPVVVSIFNNFAFPELVFLLFKISVIALVWILLVLLTKFSKKKKILGKIALAYITLALVFSIGVVIYDIGIIMGISIPVVNDLAALFFRSLGML